MRDEHPDHYTCVMASVFKHPRTPKQASRKRSSFDRLIEPKILKALAEPSRVQLLSCLLKCGRPCSVTEVAACCSIDFSMVARHLGTLARAGILTSEKKGRTVWYSANASMLSMHFRDLADSIDELTPAEGCLSDDECGCCKPRGTTA